MRLRLRKKQRSTQRICEGASVTVIISGNKIRNASEHFKK